MKFKIDMILEGEDSLKIKMDHANLSNPNLTFDLVKAIAQNLVLAFGLTAIDKVNVSSFIISSSNKEISAENIPTPEIQDEKKVEE